jgi:putative ABC transport system permease protein
MYWGILQARLIDGTFKPVQLVGSRQCHHGRAPGAQMVAGRIEDLRLPNAVIIDELAIERLSRGRPRPIGVGDTFEINDREARVVGVCRTERHFFGYPYVFASYDQALQFAPRQRKMLSMILAEPKQGLTADEVANAIRSETGLAAYTVPQFEKSTISWIWRNTGIPASFMTTIILGFIVGIAIAGQTFYSFVLENLRHLGALKAMGASNGLLSAMLLFQAFTVGLIGYGHRTWPHRLPSGLPSPTTANPRSSCCPSRSSVATFVRHPAHLGIRRPPRHPQGRQTRTRRRLPRLTRLHLFRTQP